MWGSSISHAIKCNLAVNLIHHVMPRSFTCFLEPLACNNSILAKWDNLFYITCRSGVSLVVYLLLYHQKCCWNYFFGVFFIILWIYPLEVHPSLFHKLWQNKMTFFCYLQLRCLLCNILVIVLHIKNIAGIIFLMYFLWFCESTHLKRIPDYYINYIFKCNPAVIWYTRWC